MADKKELEERLNEELDTDIEYSRMYKEDMEELLGKAESGELIEALLKKYAKDHGTEAVKGFIDDWRPGDVISKVI